MTNFATLSYEHNPNLWHNINDTHTLSHDARLAISEFESEFDCHQHIPPDLSSRDNENEQTAWLIKLFNNLFKRQQVILIHASDLGKSEPEYLPASIIDGQEQPAKICFAHGFFASSLHEISHWTIAGKQRRQLTDFGYWYVPDGRNEQQQHDFEQLEIKPQAIECLFTLACKRPFKVSQDNLFADFDTSHSTFATDVFSLASSFLEQPQKLPRDAQTLLAVLYKLCARM